MRPISYADPTDDQWKKGVEPHINPYVLDHLAGILKFFRTADTKNEKSFRVSGTVANFIGASPQTLLQFVQANRVLFGDAA